MRWLVGWLAGWLVGWLRLCLVMKNNSKKNVDDIVLFVHT